MIRQAFFGAEFLLGTLSLAMGGHPEASGELKGAAPVSEFPFVRGANELEIDVGGYWSIGTKGDATRPDTGFALGTISYGWMLSDVQGDGCFRGNWEFLLSAFGGGIFDGPGDGLAGANFSFRYNFVQPQARIVPFIQLGAGGVYSDAANDDGVQRLIGSDWSFDLQGSVGLRFLPSDRFAITVKAEFRHFSNAGLADRNYGLNSLGGVLGMSFFY